MAGVAEDQGFSAACGHDLDPLRLLSACVLFEIFECSHVMHFDPISYAGCSALCWSGKEEGIAALSSPQNGTCKFPRMLAQAFRTPVAGRGFTTVNFWL
jgi:hypothetical protein